MWQLHRLAWKSRILAEIAVAERAPPIPLPPHPTPFEKVAVAGRLDLSRLATYGDDVRDVGGGVFQGTQLIAPLLRPGEAPLLVDLGWVPNGQRPATPSGPVTLSGYMRPSEAPSWLSAPDDPRARRVYTLDAARIGAALGLAQVAPDILVVLGRQDTRHWPVPAEYLPRPPNDHLQYALTWFGFGGLCLIYFVLFARRMWDETKAAARPGGPRPRLASPPTPYNTR